MNEGLRRQLSFLSPLAFLEGTVYVQQLLEMEVKLTPTLLNPRFTVLLSLLPPTHLKVMLSS